MADNKLSELNVDISKVIDIPELLKGLKAVERSVKKAKQAVAEVNSKIEYTIIIVDSPLVADAINRGFEYSPNFKIEAYTVGSSVLGLHHNGIRPTMVIKAYEPTTDIRVKQWERDCLNTIGYNDSRTTWVS